MKGVGWANAAKVATRKLDMLDYAAVLTDLASPPGNRPEALKGDLRGFHSIRINDQWRIVFRWTDSGPKLGAAFRTSPEFWLHAQKAVDLHQAARHLSSLPKPLRRAGSGTCVTMFTGELPSTAASRQAGTVRGRLT